MRVGSSAADSSRSYATEGVTVMALARSDAAAATVRGLGATAVTGDLGDRDTMEGGMRGCDAVIHAAAHVADHGRLADFLRVNVDGTKTTLAAARAAGVPRFVFVSTRRYSPTASRSCTRTSRGPILTTPPVRIRSRSAFPRWPSSRRARRASRPSVSGLASSGVKATLRCSQT